MMVIICYDISDSKTRNLLVKYLEKIAVRVQYSVFLGDWTSVQIKKFQAYAKSVLPKDGRSDVRVFQLQQAEWAKERYLPGQCIYI